MVRSHGVSEVGPVRKINEDYFAADEMLQLFVVADGLGGHAAGEVASRLAVEAISGFMRRSHNEAEISWPYGIDPTSSFDANRLRTAVCLANRRVFRAAANHDHYTGMGTTVVGALFSGSRLIVAHVGDSRVYLMSEGKFTRLTQDDSWGATVLAEQFRDDPDQLVRHPMRKASAVWRPTGVTFKWKKVDARATADRAVRPRVIINDGKGEMPKSGGAPLGWVNFTGDEPDGDIHVSRGNAEALLRAAAGLAGPTRRITPRESASVFGRILGRVLAYEIGHYLLRSKTHSGTGLMRGRRAIFEFMADPRRGFEVHAAERQAVAARIRGSVS